VDPPYGVALQPLTDRLGGLLGQRDCLDADETPVRQLDPGSGKTRQACHAIVLT
jgi:hypothetical protein